MGKMIVVGNDLFDDFMRDNGYFVDKLEIIYELVTQMRNKVTLFIRLHRFGKTLTMNTVAIDNGWNDKRQDLHEGLYIHQSEDCRCGYSGTSANGAKVWKDGDGKILSEINAG